MNNESIIKMLHGELDSHKYVKDVRLISVQPKCSDVTYGWWSFDLQYYVKFIDETEKLICIKDMFCPFHDSHDALPKFISGDDPNEMESMEIRSKQEYFGNYSISDWYDRLNSNHNSEDDEMMSENLY